MALLSANFLTANKTLLQVSNHPTINPSRSSRFLPISTPPPLLHPPSRARVTFSAAVAAAAAAAATTTTTTTTGELQLQEKRTPESLPKWQEFAARVSGEWDGFGAEFTVEGKPVELPESVVPEAFREWGVQVFDWQTQCPTLAAEAGDPLLTYKMIKLLPTVGCEADAATAHSVEERIAGGDGNKVSLFGYDPSGCYVAVWPVEGWGGQRLLEVEHCMVNPGDPEVRVRVIQVVKVEGGIMLERIKVFSEQWYGPFRNGEQLGGCAIRESGFASAAAVKESEVVGVWQGTSVVAASFGSEQTDIFHELVADKPQKMIRDQLGLVPLPKQLWCSVKEKDGETLLEVGWLLDHGCAMTSRCLFLQNGSVKEMAVSKETAVLEDI